MTAIARTWDHLTLPGKALFILIPLLALLTIGLVVVIALFGQQILDILIFNLPIVRFVFAATVLLLLSAADRVRDHLHGDEDHRPDEPPDRAGPGRAVGHRCCRRSTGSRCS